MIDFHKIFADLGFSYDHDEGGPGASSDAFIKNVNENFSIILWNCDDFGNFTEDAFKAQSLLDLRLFVAIQLRFDCEDDSLNEVFTEGQFAGNYELQGFSDIIAYASYLEENIDSLVEKESTRIASENYNDSARRNQ